MNRRDKFVFFLEVCAMLTSAWGLYHIYGISTTAWACLYNGLWFIFGVVSNLAGVISACLYEFEETDSLARIFLQSHYLMSWMTVVIGYPTLVAHTWLVYSGGCDYCLYHSALTLIPFYFWLRRQNEYIVLATQITIGSLMLSHFYIYLLASNTYGMIGVLLMIVNLVSLSVPIPVRFYRLLISSRESFIIGLGVTSYIFSLAVEEMAKNPNKVTQWYPSLPSIPLPW